MVKITSREELELWLEDKPADWAQVILSRTALRVLPLATFERIIFETKEHANNIFRCSFIAWAASSLPDYDISTAAFIAADYSNYIEDLSSAAKAISHSVYYTHSSNHYDAKNILISATKNPNENVIWKAINRDANWLENNKYDSVCSKLTQQPLWFGINIPVNVLEAWGKSIPNLIAHTTHIYHWIQWYERRLAGKKSAFDIPHDIDRTEDNMIIKKIADAGEDFWDKGTKYVNAQLDEWLREARQRAQERYEQENDGLVNDDLAPKIPEQNSNAITFKAGLNGKIAIDVQASLDEILSDEDSQERHQMALDEAKALQEKCATSNSGAQLSPLLVSYIENLGSSIEQIRPSLSVLKGEKLRQTLAAYQSKNSMMQPLSDDLLVDLNSWQSAHNMMVAFQPKLNALDTAMLGPDRQPAAFTPDDLRTLTKDAENSELLEEGTKEILDETADLAPLEFDPGNRRIKRTAETTKNLLIETAKIAKSHPRKTGVTGAVTAIAIANPAISIPLATAAALFLIKHREWVEEKMGNTPTWKSIFVSICEQYDEIVNFNKDKEGND